MSMLETPWQRMRKAALVGLVLLLVACGGDPYRKLTALEQHIYLQPTEVATQHTFDRVAMGYWHSCMLSIQGEAWCWGSNEYGQLGAATSESCAGGNIPCSWQAVRAVSPRVFSSLSPAHHHTCGLDAAGQAWCWGFGLGGQLGDGLRTDSAAPVAVAGAHRFVELDAGRGAFVSCGLDDAGAAWCWGPANGALGNGTEDSSAVPVQVQAPQPFTSISTGAEHACGLDASGQAWCWGSNLYGVLGSGESGKSLLPNAVTGGPRFARIAAGGVVTCGLTTEGQAWCWGFAQATGTRSTTHVPVPAAVSGGHVFSSLSVGYQHACGLATDGTAWCWGPATLVGGGTEEERQVPVQVVGGHRFRALQSGGVATCGLTIEGRALCWGMNTYGSVGQSNVDR